MEIPIKSVSLYKTVINLITVYMLHPNDEKERQEMFSYYVMTDIINYASLIELSHFYKMNPGNLALISPSSLAYKKPNKGYSFHKLSIAADLLVLMLRMQKSGITPSLRKAIYAYLMLIDENGKKLSQDKINSKFRAIKAIWAEYRTVAHIAYVMKMMNGVFTIANYPLFLSLLYSLQGHYLELIKANEYLDFDIWILGNIESLDWCESEKEHPQSFLKRMNKGFVFEILDKNERAIVDGYKHDFFG